MTDRGDNDEQHDSFPDWRPEPRDCPFGDVDSRICGCPTGEQIQARLMDEAHITRGSE